MAGVDTGIIAFLPKLFIALVIVVIGSVIAGAVGATLGGIAVVGVGVELIVPMRQRWERWLSNAEQESARVRRHRAETTANGTVPAAPAQAAPAPAPTQVDPSPVN